MKVLISSLFLIVACGTSTGVQNSGSFGYQEVQLDYDIVSQHIQELDELGIKVSTSYNLKRDPTNFMVGAVDRYDNDDDLRQKKKALTDFLKVIVSFKSKYYGSTVVSEDQQFKLDDEHPIMINVLRHIEATQYSLLQIDSKIETSSRP